MTECRGGFGPTPPDPNGTNGEVKKYDLEVTYIRTEILYEPHANTYPGSTLLLASENAAQQIADIHFTKKDNYKFVADLFQISSNGSKTYYCFHTVDVARHDGLDNSSVVVGDRYIIKVKQTGFEKELKDIRYNGLQINPYPGPKAKMACFKLTKDGTIISDTQNSY